MKIDMNAQKIMRILQDNGFEAYIVGGSVRDLALNKNPKDFDITTNALPDQVCKIFNDLKILNIPTGIKFGTITIVIDSEHYEVTTYRIDGEYLDSRKPKEVEFTSNLINDLSRRDFTMNAIAFNDKDGFVDPFGGILDIQNKIIRAVGNPVERFKEDALRMLRAIRFFVNLNFEIEEETYRAIKLNKDGLKNISKERIRDELEKIVLSNRPKEGIKKLNETGLLEYIIPELCKGNGFDQHNSNHKETVFNHILSVLENTPPIKNVRMAALLHDIAKPSTYSIDLNGVGHFYGHENVGYKLSKEILKDLKYDNKTINEVSNLVKDHMDVPRVPTKTKVKRLLRKVGVELIYDLISLQRADMISKGKDDSVFDEIKIIVENIIKDEEAISLKDLDIHGEDLMKLGAKGKEIGELKNYLLDRVIENDSLNKKEILIDLAREKIKNEK